MDDRISQKKELKKAYKKLRAKAGLGWNIPGWILLVICMVLACVTLFVLCKHTAPVQLIDAKVWQPVKAAMGDRIPYEMVWNLAAQYGIVAVLATGLLAALCFILGGCAMAAVKKTDAYLNYRTMKLTLETEKEEM